MHKEDFGPIEEEMIMQCGNAEAVVERSGHGGIHFIFKENGVAHHHGAVFCGSECSPGAKTHKRRHAPSVDNNLHVTPRKSNFINSWLLLLYSLPARQKTERVAVWRRLKRIGAVQIKTSTYLLPDNPPQYEHFQWLTQQIRDFGGDATLVHAQEIEGLSNEKLIALF